MTVLTGNFGRHRRKIAPVGVSDPVRPEFSYIGAANPAVAEWAAAGLPEPDFGVIRAHRLARLRAELARPRLYGLPALRPDQHPLRDRRRQHAGLEPAQLHSYVFVATDGPVVLFDYAQAKHLGAKTSRWSTRSGPAAVGSTCDAPARQRPSSAAPGPWRRRSQIWLGPMAAGTAGSPSTSASRSPWTCSVPRVSNPIARARSSCEEARRIKHPGGAQGRYAGRSTAARPASPPCGAGFSAGITENQLWARLHEANIARGGEWIETRLLASGPRTNPWFHECSDRPIEVGDMVAFDTDLIGPYGYCADISRSWVTPGRAPTAGRGTLTRRRSSISTTTSPPSSRA